MGKARKAIGARKVAKLVAALGPKRAAKKLEVSESTLRRWKREGVPVARRPDVARIGAKPRPRPPPAAPATSAAPRPTAAPHGLRNVKWKDTAGRWRDRTGTFTKAPHRKKGEEPRPRKHAPPPKPPKPPRPRPPRPPEPPQPTPKRPAEFPRKLLEEGGKLQSRSDGKIFRLPDLGTPEGLRELAERLGKSPSTIRSWIQKDHVPLSERANLRAIERGSRVYETEWASGRRSTWTRAEYQEVRDAFLAFKTLRDTGGVGIHEAYVAWRAVKMRIRALLTRAAWRKLFLRIARAAGLPMIGPGSAERFIES